MHRKSIRLAVLALCVSTLSAGGAAFLSGSASAEVGAGEVSYRPISYQEIAEVQEIAAVPESALVTTMPVSITVGEPLVVSQRSGLTEAALAAERAELAAERAELAAQRSERAVGLRESSLARARISLRGGRFPVQYQSASQVSGLRYQRAPIAYSSIEEVSYPLASYQWSSRSSECG